MALVFNFGTSANPLLKAIQKQGYIWSDTGIRYNTVTINYFLDDTVKAWTPFEKDAYQTALQSWANVANFTIQPVAVEGEADLIELQVSTLTFDKDNTLADHDTPLGAINKFSQAYGRYNYNASGWTESGLEVGGRGYKTIVHELGHALGLAHSFDNPLGIFPGLANYPADERSQHTGDNGLSQMYWTVMSYIMTTNPTTANVDKTSSGTWRNEDGEIEYSFGYVSGPMAFDIAAIQTLYGANTNYRTGDDIYYLPNVDGPGAYWTSIWDAGGANAIAYSGSRNVTINLIAATLDNSPTGGGALSYAQGVHGGFTIANGVAINAAYGGSGNDTLTGNAAGNIMDGGGGADTMRGGGGNDIYEVGHVGDVVIEGALEGNADRINSYISIDALAPNVEDLVLYGELGDGDLYGVGNELRNVINGNVNNNAMYGLGENDTIYGYGGHDKLDGGFGNDTMVGGPGDDIYEVDSLGDVVTENFNEGTDRFDSYISIDALPANVENIVLYGAVGAPDLYAVANNLRNVINGSDTNNSLYGLDDNDTIYGYRGNDKLDGGFGDDTMVGGPDDDIYEVDSINDSVTENFNEGVDRVDSYISITLGPNVENLVLYGFGNLDGTGNELPNVFNGTSGQNTLKGLGGNDQLYGYTGNDTLEGGTGFDTAFFLDPRASHTIVRNGAIVTVTGPAGTDTLTSIELLQFSDTARSVRPSGNDFNGDGRADILFSNQGAVFASNYEWQLNDRAISGQGALDLYDKNFTVQVTGDFNGDGRGDVIFENPNTGGVWEWRLNGAAIASQGAVDVGDKTYHLLGAADFDGNGTSDLLWRNDAGFIYQWLMKVQATTAGSNTPVAVQALDPHWHVVGAGDFDADGNADLLLRNIGGAASENGAFFLWMMNGNTVKAQGGIERPGTDWVTLGTGDFDGDGKTDFAVRHVSNFGPGEAHGAVWIYLMNGATIKAQGAAGIADAAQFQVAGIGDYNFDGKDDILFRNSTGSFYSWDMNGTHIQSEGAVPWAHPSQQVVTQHWDLV